VARVLIRRLLGETTPQIEHKKKSRDAIFVMFFYFKILDPRFGFIKVRPIFEDLAFSTPPHRARLHLHTDEHTDEQREINMMHSVSQLIFHLALGLLLGALCGVGMTSSNGAARRLAGALSVGAGAVCALSAVALRLIDPSPLAAPLPVERLADVVMGGVATGVLVSALAMGLMGAKGGALRR
jgi:hypothetical protein